MTATFTKLKCGEWGITVEGGSVTEGQTVSVRKRDGSETTVTVVKVVFRGGRTSICAIQSNRPAPPARPTRRRSDNNYIPESVRKCPCRAFRGGIMCDVCRHIMYADQLTRRPEHPAAPFGG